MDVADRIEWGVDGLAAGLFGAAVAYALAAANPSLAFASIGGAVAVGACLAGLRRVAIETPQYALAAFPLSPLPAPLEELVLTDADRLECGAALELDDVLEQMGPGSRVVRLFDRHAMPTPGQLKARIDRHLVHGSSPTAPHDASQDLHQALAELRRTLR